MSIAIAATAPSALHTPPMRRRVIAGATFGVAFLMRPLVGMLIGASASRHGRHAAMTPQGQTQPTAA